jgi:hypothetical protein
MFVRSADAPRRVALATIVLLVVAAPGARPVRGQPPTPRATAAREGSPRPGLSPSALPLEAVPAPRPRANPSAAAPPSGSAGPATPADEIAAELFAGQVLRPIDLVGALRLAGAQNPDIAYARKQVLQAIADLEQARALWLPTLFIGPTYYRVDGQVQNINGVIETASRSSLSWGRRRPWPTASRRPRRGPATRRSMG